MPSSFVCSLSSKEVHVNLSLAAALALCLIVVVYLVYALVYPERF
jgi:hypothetical protein